MDKKVISCAFNIDTACVEVKFADGSMIALLGTVELCYLFLQGFDAIGAICLSFDFAHLENYDKNFEICATKWKSLRI